MVSSFASQLQAIASKSSSELDLKARRSAHAESLLFDRDVAVKQDFGTIYNICIEGFYELCQLDSRFRDFERNLFAEYSKDQDREEMSKSQNEALNLVIKRCLMLLGGKILLKPALKALEWLVRRFRIHVHNVDDLLSTLLPYHEVSVWANALSIVPNDKIPGQWKFVRPYLKTTWNIPRHAIAYAASHNDAFFASLNSFALDLCRQGLGNSIYMTFWSAIVVEAITSRLAQTRSGRKEVQTQRVEDLLLKVLPLLSEGYEIPGSADMLTTCYTITLVLAAKAELADHLLDSLLLAVCQSFDRTDHERPAAMITAAVLASHKASPTVPKKVLEILSHLDDFSILVKSISDKQSCHHLLKIVMSTVTTQIKRKNVKKLAAFTVDIIHLFRDLYPDDLVDGAITPLASRLLEPDTPEGSAEVRNELVALVQDINKDRALSTALYEAMSKLGSDSEMLENLLGMTLTLPEPTSQGLEEDTPMADAGSVVLPATKSLDSVPSVWEHGSSFLTVSTSKIFIQISDLFETCCFDAQKLRVFKELPLWSSAANSRLLWQSFLIRIGSSNCTVSVRQKALQMLTQEIQDHPAVELQFFIPYALMLLTDVKAIRQSASNLLSVIQDFLPRKGKAVSSTELYAADAMQQITPIPQKQVTALLVDTIYPVLEECVLDHSHISKVVQDSLLANTTTEVKKSHRLALFSLLTQHAVATPIIRLKVSAVAMLTNVQKVGGKSKTKLLQPILQQWSTHPEDTAMELANESGNSVEAVDAAFVVLTDAHDGHYLEEFASATSLGRAPRTGLVRAFFGHMRHNWKSLTSDEQIASAETLFNISFCTNEALSAGAQEVLRAVDLSSEVLATLLQASEVGTSGVRGPPSKKKRRSSSGTSQSRIDVIKSIDNTTAKIGFILELVENNHPEQKSELISVMFEMLACLRQLQQNSVESPYLLNLCLSSIFAMAQPLTFLGKSADVSGIKPELVTECLRSSENPQVQNSSLLVLAALSSVVPDRMVHNVMPIFTFIGHNMVSKDDEHSINVVNEAIDKIVPALLQSLRKGNNLQTYQTSMSTMLANFTSAYEHIPRHRRVAFYQKLLFSIAAEEFGYILIALLAAQEGKKESFKKFLQDLSSTLTFEAQLAIYQQLVRLTVDVLSASPKASIVVFNIGRSTSAKDKTLYARSSLNAGIVILQSPDLASGIGGGSRLISHQAERLTEQLRSSFETTLRAIEEIKSADGDVVLLVKQCLDALLQLPKTADLLTMLESTLDDMEETQLRPQALRVLALQLQGKRKKDNRARAPALSLIPRLNGYIDPQQNAALVQASLACVNCIIEVYGRKDPELIVAVAENILDHGLAPFKKSPKVMEAAILTIASVVEATKEGSVPLVMGIVSQILGVLQPSASSQPSLGLFNSACALLSAMVSNVAFILSQEQITEILNATLVIREDADLQQDDTDFMLLLRSMAQKVDLEVLVGSSMAVLDKQTETQVRMSGTLLDTIQQAIDASSKTVVVKNAESISQLFERMLGIEADRLVNNSDEDRQTALSNELKSTSIKFIYKINDTTFRPIFESWIDWATSTEIADPSQKAGRQLVLFDLLIHFFDNLKAIVTSYATYLLTPISAILKSAVSIEKTSTTTSNDSLITKTLSLLRTIAMHDQDSFFSAPSNFESVAEPSVSLLRLASTKSKRALVSSQVMPTIIALATATMDSPSTHSALVHFIVGFKPHSSARVRLASVQTLIALTEDEDVGDEFLANTIGIGLGEGEGARGGGSSVGEIMVYVNEMLEDDDEDVEREVRRWVQMVRAKVGEDIFEV